MSSRLVHEATPASIAGRMRFAAVCSGSGDVMRCIIHSWPGNGQPPKPCLSPQRCSAALDATARGFGADRFRYREAILGNVYPGSLVGHVSDAINPPLTGMEVTTFWTGRRDRKSSKS